MLAAGASLLVAASFASASGASPSIHKGGTLKIGTTGNLDSVDPAIAYGTTSWWFEFSTRANLYTYPDRAGAAGGKLIPEVAKGFTVSKNGRVYTFHLKSGYRFSDGAKVTAKNFAYAIKRATNKELNSPAGPFIKDKSAVNIAGVKASGLTLKITLKRADPNLITVMAMPFFQAASLKLPLTKEVLNVKNKSDLPTAGPVRMVVQRSEQPGEHRSQHVLPRAPQAQHRWCSAQHEPQHHDLLQPDQG